MENIETILAAYAIGIFLGFSAGISIMYVFLKITGKIKEQTVSDEPDQDDFAGRRMR